MRTLVLRKSVGPLSAGTPIPKDNIPPDLVTVLRNRTDLVPINNRAKRRQSKNAEYIIMKELGF
jgi:hypothetical protein